MKIVILSKYIVLSRKDTYFVSTSVSWLEFGVRKLSSVYFSSTMLEIEAEWPKYSLIVVVVVELLEWKNKQQ